MTLIRRPRMRVARLFTLVSFASGIWAGLSAQIPTRRPSSQTATSSAPRLLVGNPHSFTPQDSAPSVAMGEGIRSRLDKVVSTQFRVVTRAEMNEALKQFGYPPDAILGQLPLRALAQSLNAKVLVVSTISKDAGGKYSDHVADGRSQRRCRQCGDALTGARAGCRRSRCEGSRRVSPRPSKRGLTRRLV